MSSETEAQAPLLVLRPRAKGMLYPVAWGLFLSLVVAGPWLANGYLFGTDWPGPRHFSPPLELASAAPIQLLLAALGAVFSAEFVGKAMFIGCFYLAAVGAFVASPARGFIPRAAASTIFTINPFVYGRIHYGQLFLVAAYAVLPLVALSVRRLLAEPGPLPALFTALSSALAGAFSPHVLLITGLLVAVTAVTWFVATPERASALKRTAPWAVAAAAMSVVLTSYWVLPLIGGHGTEAGIIGSTSAGAVAAYAARPDSVVGLIPNLLGLYGFWAEDVGRFTSMKAFAPAWPYALAALLAVCAIGFVSGLRDRRSGLAPWAIGLVAAGAIALVLEVGVSSPVTAGLVTWLDAHFAIYRGMRDAGKWAALLALVYSQLVGLGAASLLEWVSVRLRNPFQKEWAAPALGALLLALPLAYGNGLLFGAHGEIKPSQYPSGWYAADRMLLGDPNHGRVLFLPWHEYMRYSFIENQNNVVASPAPSFFSVPILASQDPEVSGIAPPATPEQEAVRGLVAEGSSADWGGTLAKLGVRYVLVDKDLDWQTYRYLDSQQGLTKVSDLGSILVYRNEVAAPSVLP